MNHQHSVESQDGGCKPVACESSNEAALRVILFYQAPIGSRLIMHGCEVVKLDDEHVRYVNRNGNQRVWYDRHTRSWVVQTVDRDGNQIGDAYFCHRKSEAMNVAESRLR